MARRGGSAERTGALPFSLVASTVALDLNLTTITGETRPLHEWVTTFHLASVVLDPYTNESSWILTPPPACSTRSAAPTCA